MRWLRFAPDLTYYVTGFSKSFGAGLRVAYIRAPPSRRAQHLAGALRATTVMASPFTVLLATQWVGDGTADLMLDAIRTESAARQELASRVLVELEVRCRSGRVSFLDAHYSADCGWQRIRACVAIAIARDWGGFGGGFRYRWQSARSHSQSALAVLRISMNVKTRSG